MKRLKSEDEANDTLSYETMNYLKQIVTAFKDNKDVFEFVVNDAIRKWKRCDQKALAELLVSIIFGELGEPIQEIQDDKSHLNNLNK